MSTVIAIGGWTLFGAAIVAGLALNLVGLFGNWIILAALGTLWAATGFMRFTALDLFILLLLAIAGEMLETLLAGYGARKFGGSKGSMVAALVGTLGGAMLGTPIFPIVGTLLGACAGAFAGAALYDYIQHEKSPGDAMWAGTGAAIGKIGGLLAKLICGLIMLAVAWLAW